MKSLRCAFLLGLAVASLSAQYPLPNGSRVLFIGNSLTGQSRGGLPAYINAALAAGRTGIAMQAHRQQIWAQSLKKHWENTGPETDDCTAAGVGQYAGMDKTQIHARLLLERGHPDGHPWDYVVLQDYADDGAENTIAADGTLSGDFFVYADYFIALARQYQAEPILYMRVANNPAQVDAKFYEGQVANLIRNYEALGRHRDVLVVPVAKINDQLSRQPPAGQSTGWLYSDGIHPSDFGLAVQMYTFTSLLARRSYRETPVSYGKYLATDAALDRALREAVDDVVQPLLALDQPYPFDLPDWPDGQTDGYLEETWLGGLYFSQAHYPWIFHGDHGWLYLAGDRRNLFAFDGAVGWWYTAEGSYPFLYSLPASAWWYYFPGSRAPRFFWDFSAQVALQYP